VGVEVAEAAVSRARINAPGAEVHLTAPDDDLPLPDDSVHLVWCSEVLEHVADTRRLLGEVRRVLAPGGRVLVTTPFHGRLYGAALALGRFDSHFDPLGEHLRFYTRSSLARVLAEAGLRDVDVQALGGLPFARRTLVARARKG
jgi:ubiquinone/menaquinone biosynthesis C-methylase UbiE